VELLGSSRVAGGPEVELTEPFLSCVTQAWHRTYCLRSDEQVELHRRGWQVLLEA
jgi:hypothetical protein